MKTRGLIYGFFIIFILLLLTSSLLSQPVVLDAKPTVRIYSDESSTTIHYFIDPRGGGYVKVFDRQKVQVPKSLKSTRTPGPRYEYMEHLTFSLGSITYWGATDTFEP